MTIKFERALSLMRPGLHPRWAWVLTATLVALPVALVVMWSASVGDGFPTQGERRALVEVREAVLIELGRTAVTGMAPPPAAAGTPVHLPHRIRHGDSLHVNYRVTLDRQLLPSYSGGPLAVCVGRWSSSATVWLNGHLIRLPAPGTAGLLDMQRPELVMLPFQHANGPMVLDVQLRVVPGAASGLSTVRFGDGVAIREGCQAQLRQTHDLRLGSAYLMVFMGMVVLAIGVLKRDRLAYFFFLMVVGWCSHHVFVLGQWTAMDESTWMALFHATRPLAVLPLALFVLSYIDQPNGTVPIGLLLLYGVAYGLFAVIPESYWVLWISVFGLILLMVMSWLLFAVLVHCSRHFAISTLFFCMALALGISFNLLDIARAREWLPWESLSFSQFSVPALSVAMGAMLVERLKGYLDNERLSARKLQEEVCRQRVKIAEDYQRMKAQGEKIAVLEERKRIVREMHDGLGSQLVSVSAILRSSSADAETLSGAIEGALSELRSVLDVLSTNTDSDDHEDDPVALLLGRLRYRLQPIFRAQDIEIDWQVEPLPRDFLPTDQLRLQLLRLMQEACANVLKHAHARKVSLCAKAFDDCVIVELRDDGVGIDRGQPGSESRHGYGLANMLQRANEMGAKLSISDLDPGTSVQLVFPLSSK